MQNKKSGYIKGIAVWIFIWQILSIIIGQEILLVSPLSALTKLFEFVFIPDFWISVMNSFVRIISGFLIALAVGTFAAIFSYFNKSAKFMIEPIVLTIQAIPVASFIILALVWISSEYLSTFISFLMVFPVIYRNILTGIMSIPQEIIDMTKVFDVPVKNRIRYIYLSEMAPYIKSACSVSLGLCWKSGIAAEVIGLPVGTIGENLYNAKIYLNTAELFAWTIVIVIISIGFQKLFLYLIQKIFERQGLL